ncbi:phytochelatin synthase family protein [Kiloniella laminariae]|uniref:phytochelatin synthase family protein n=1 Tax=Kiloniella laminariae TaxID=454162 RepID=UPI00036E3339|nr:phytochelatin synthase family protein [Kiloniella laminariae]
MRKFLLNTALATSLVAASLFAFAPVQAAEKIYLTSPEGEQLFHDADITMDYLKLASFLESEHIVTFCGPATIAGVMNTMDVERPQPPQLYPWRLFTQTSIFTAANQAVKPYPQVEHDGLVLPQLATFFQNLGVKAEFHHADEFTEEWLRQTITDVLADPNRRFVANYSRQPIGQEGGGHISPVAAYDVETDRALVLDVARYKYPPVWLTIADLHKAMMDKDPSSNRSRGAVIVSQ